MVKPTAIVIISIAILLGGMLACSSGGSDDDNAYISAPSIEDMPTTVIAEEVEDMPTAIIPEEVEDVPTAVTVEEVAEETANEPATETVTTQTVEPIAAEEPEPEIPELYLELTSPLNETVVKNSSVQVTGNTIPTAIVSVNGMLTSVNPEGAFTTNTTLEAGVNFIEVVTSDLEGNELGEVLTVVYLSS